MWFSMSPKYVWHQKPRFYLIAHSIAEATAAANRIIHVRPSAEDKKKKPDIPKGGRPASIQFHDVHFKYLGRDMPVLRGVNIKVLHSIYICGNSNCGRFNRGSLQRS